VSGATNSGLEFERQMAAARRDPELLRAGQALVDNDLPTAERILRPYLKRRPTDVAAIRMMAELAARVGRLADSENLLRRSLDLAPGFTAARANLATVLYKQNRAAEAIAELETIERLGDAHLGHSSLKAAALGRLGGHDEALALYRTILASRPDQPKIWMSFGHILKTVGEHEEGVAAYRQAIQLQPSLGEAWWSLANLKTFRFAPEDIQAMRGLLDGAALGDEDRFHLHFALGNLNSAICIFNRQSVTYGMSAIWRARFSAVCSLRWCIAHVPEMRRGRILPRSGTNGISSFTSL
jgi:tetratricopeptide (TPR) repeat protein